MVPAKTKAFTSELAKQSLTEVEIAVALVWFVGHDGDHHEVSVREVAELIQDSRLRGQINVHRLASNMSKHADLVRGRGVGTFRIKAASERALADKYAKFRRTEALAVGDHIIPDSLSLGGRKHLEAIRREANGAYEFGFYNSAAVMCRRLTELLLIEAFDKSGNIAAITDTSGNLVTFGDLINVAKSGKPIRFSRSLPGTLDRVKATGDGAAHNRYYAASQRDLDELNPGLRQALAELAALARL